MWESHDPKSIGQLVNEQVVKWEARNKAKNRNWVDRRWRPKHRATQAEQKSSDLGLGPIGEQVEPVDGKPASIVQTGEET